MNNYFSDAKNRTDYPNRSGVINKNYGYLRTEANYSKNSIENDNPAGHETGHVLGLTDYYDKNTLDPLAGWEGDIMAEDVRLPVSIDDRHINSILNVAVSRHQSGIEWVKKEFRMPKLYQVTTQYKISVRNAEK